MGWLITLFCNMAYYNKKIIYFMSPQAPRLPIGMIDVRNIIFNSLQTTTIFNPDFAYPSY